MSLVNGDKSRQHRLRKKKIALRLRLSTLAAKPAAAAVEPQVAKKSTK